MEPDDTVQTVGQITVSDARIWREQLKAIGARLWKMRATLIKADDDGSILDKGEAIANTVQAYRHLEDCVMRLGKVCEAVEGHRDPANAPLEQGQ